MKHIILSLIRGYQRFISPFFAVNSCRFTPTCSEFMYEAISRYGIINGVTKGCKRILRCHPWHEGGYDPVS